MFWPDNGTGVDVQPARKTVNSAIRKFFAEGGNGSHPTIPGGDWFNQITNELLNVLAAAGIDPSKADDDQLQEAISILCEGPSDALRQLLSSPPGSENIGFGSETVLSILSDKSVTPESQGATGDGIQNDQEKVESAILYANSSVHLKSGSRYLVNSLNNPLGKPLLGPGHVVKSAVGGLKAITTYVDQFQRVTGQENLAFWYRKLYDQLSSLAASPKIVFSGDSTTEGVGVNENYKIHNLVRRGLYINGCNTLSGIDTVNAGHSGAPTDFWDGTYVTQDIAQAPDLYIVRWGINDPGWLSAGGAAPLDAGQNYPGRRTIDDFAYNLRSGLSKYRASIPFASGSILLMMPNSTYDIPNARDALWYEQLRDVYIQAARDFQCAFIDTYAILQDSSQLANILMDDPMATSGRGVHPNNVMNCLIAEHIVNLIAPSGFKYSNDFPSNSILSISGGDLLPGADLVPSAYNSALYFVRCIIPNGWPIDGNAITFRSSDNTLIQLLYGYKNADRGKLMIRFGRADDLGGEGEGWSDWSTFSMAESGWSFSQTDAVPASGFTLPSAAAMRIAAEGGMRCIDGYLKKISPSVIAANTQIATFNGIYAPGREAAYGTATIWDGAAFEQVPVIIATPGVILIAKTTTLSAQRVYINVSYNGNL